MVEGCLKYKHGRGNYCSAHYERRRLTGSFMADKPVRKLAPPHGPGKKREYSSWVAAKSRVLDKNRKHYNLYGGRGIVMCQEWLDSFDKFYEDMGPRPAGNSLDRIDVNGNYEPNNCRWATQTVQNINRNDNKNNTSGYRGVYKEKRHGGWFAQIGVNHKYIHLGTFREIEKAVEARKAGELKYWGQYAA